MFSKHPSFFRTLRLCASFLVACQPALALAQDTGSSTRFTGKLGFVNTAGNTRETIFNAGNKLTQTLGYWTVRQELNLIHGRDDSTTTENFYRAALRTRYAATPRLSPLAYVSWERDTPAGLSRRFEEGVGVAYHALQQRQDTLVLEIGPTLVQESRVAQAGTHFAAGRAAATYLHRFAKRATLEQLVEYLPDLGRFTNFHFNAETVLAAPIAGVLALEISYEVRYVHLPPPGRRRSDRFLIAGLQITL